MARVCYVEAIKNKKRMPNNYSVLYANGKEFFPQKNPIIFDLWKYPTNTTKTETDNKENIKYANLKFHTGNRIAIQTKLVRNAEFLGQVSGNI